MSKSFTFVNNQWVAGAAEQASAVKGLQDDKTFKLAFAQCQLGDGLQKDATYKVHFIEPDSME